MANVAQAHIARAIAMNNPWVCGCVSCREAQQDAYALINARLAQAADAADATDAANATLNAFAQLDAQREIDRLAIVQPNEFDIY